MDITSGLRPHRPPGPAQPEAVAEPTTLDHRAEPCLGSRGTSLSPQLHSGGQGAEQRPAPQAQPHLQTAARAVLRHNAHVGGVDAGPDEACQVIELDVSHLERGRNGGQVGHGHVSRSSAQDITHPSERTCWGGAQRGQGLSLPGLHWELRGGGLLLSFLPFAQEQPLAGPSPEGAPCACLSSGGPAWLPPLGGTYVFELEEHLPGQLNPLLVDMFDGHHISLERNGGEGEREGGSGEQPLPCPALPGPASPRGAPRGARESLRQRARGSP